MRSSYLLRGGCVYTMSPAQPWAQSVVVRDDVIAYVGPVSGARAHCDSSTVAVDLAGGMCLPGFTDGHNHLVIGALTKLGVSVRGLSGREAVLGAIAGWISGQPPDAPLRGYGWLPDAFPGRSPRREWLDQVTGDRPMLLFAADAHDVWFNTAAMRAAGISAATPDPAPGAQYYRRDADGTPTGHGVDLAGTGPLFEALGIFSEEGLSAAMAAGLLSAPSWGITSYFDAGIFTSGTAGGAAPVLARLADLDRAGGLPVRVTGSVWTRDPGDDPAAVTGLLAGWSQRFATAHLRVGACKIFADGTLMSGGALLLEPFTANPTSRGAMSMSTRHLTALITAAQQAGFDAHVHVDGDGTVRAVLDAIEQAACRAEDSAAGAARRPARHVIAHNTLIHPDDLGRYASLGVIANITPAWGTDYDGTYVDTYTSLIGANRIRERLFPNRDLLRAGAMLTIGADVPGVDITDTAPLIQLEAAVTRRRPDYPDDRPLAPHQALPLADALRAYTINGAYQLRAEDTTGSLEPGKKADLVVLSDDLFAIAPERIHATSVVLTMMDGVITHSLPGARIT